MFGSKKRALSEKEIKAMIENMSPSERKAFIKKWRGKRQNTNMI